MSKKPNKKRRPNKLDPQIREIVSTIDKCRKKGGHGKIKIKGDNGSDCCYARSLRSYDNQQEEWPSGQHHCHRDR